MYYKMYLMGYKLLTMYHSGVEHMDAGGTLSSKEKERSLIFSDFRFKTIFWHRFIFLPEKNKLMRVWSQMCIAYTFLFSLLVSLIKGQFAIFLVKKNAIENGLMFISSCQYKGLNRIVKCKK